MSDSERLLESSAAGGHLDSDPPDDCRDGRANLSALRAFRGVNGECSLQRGQNA